MLGNVSTLSPKPTSISSVLRHVNDPTLISSYKVMNSICQSTHPCLAHASRFNKTDGSTSDNTPSNRMLSVLLHPEPLLLLRSAASHTPAHHLLILNLLFASSRHHCPDNNLWSDRLTPNSLAEKILVGSCTLPAPVPRARLAALWPLLCHWVFSLPNGTSNRHGESENE